MPNLETIKEMVFETDNEACFIERERILQRLECEFKNYDKTDKYALIFSRLLSEVSTPIEDCDYFAGRVKEALPDPGMKAPNWLLFSTGHMSFHYSEILNCGLKGMLDKIKKANTDGETAVFAKNADIVVSAVRDFAKRYSAAARKKGFDRMAEALERVPYEPAYDFYSALQSVWLIHMIASCYVGSRDYAFGRFDSYMLPFYLKSLKNGMTEDEATELLAGFFIKTNEICGRSTHNYKQKPVLCQASKQYVNIGGEEPNAFSKTVLKAAMKANMAQPEINVILKPDADNEFTDAVFEAMSVLTDKLHIYNYDLIFNALTNKGIDEPTAKDFTFSACCTFDLNYHSYRLEYYVPVPQLFLKALKKQTYASLDELVNAVKEEIRADIQRDVDEKENGFKNKEFARKAFVFDGLFLTDSSYECRFACDGRAKYTVYNAFCPGVATIGDSLMVLDKLVFKEKRLEYGEFIEILENNFAGNEELRQEILSFTKFGNDTEADKYTTLAGSIFLDAADGVSLKENRYLIGGFYSLERDNSWSGEVGATPDGRLSGEPFSENQSPTYGADRNGITALLKSVARLPFYRTATGGLNLTFSGSVSAKILKALILSYFEMGGLHVGISVVNREMLEDAMVNPDKYKSLTVRLYGFSEYFISLPKWQQIAVINRTRYKC